MKDKILEAIETLDFNIEQLNRQKAKLLRELYDTLDEAEREEKGTYSLADIKEFEACAFKFKCPLKWENLEERDDKDVKYCSVCMENVYHAPNLLEFKRRVKEKKCVSVRNEDDDLLMGVGVFVDKINDDK